MIVQIYEVSTPAEAHALGAMGVECRDLVGVAGRRLGRAVAVGEGASGQCRQRRGADAAGSTG